MGANELVPGLSDFPTLPHEGAGAIGTRVRRGEKFREPEILATNGLEIHYFLIDTRYSQKLCDQPGDQPGDQSWEKAKRASAPTPKIRMTNTDGKQTQKKKGRPKK